MSKPDLHARAEAVVLDDKNLRRFLGFFQYSDGGCWNWKYSKNRYARFTIKRVEHQAHRIMWETFVGRIPDDLTIDHLCRNKKCVRPSHLEVVTLRENILRGECPPAINARQTHCSKGHPLSGDNLLLTSHGSGKPKKRACKECRHKYWNDRYQNRNVEEAWVKKRADTIRHRGRP